MPAANLNIHRELFEAGYQLNFEGIRQIRPRRHYIACQFRPEVRERLKFAKGESGYGSLLAMEKNLIPDGLLRLYPATQYETISQQVFVALAVPKRKLVYGYKEPVDNLNIAALMTTLRGSSFHKEHTSDSLFYFKDSLGFYDDNPHLQVVWSLAYGFPEEGRLRCKWPKLTEFIADGQDGYNLYQPPEKKEKTLTDDGVWGIPRLKWLRKPALQTYAKGRQVGQSWELAELEAAYNQASQGGNPPPPMRDEPWNDPARMGEWFRDSLERSTAKPPKPEPPKSLAKSGPGGRLIVFPEKEDADEG